MIAGLIHTPSRPQECGICEICVQILVVRAEQPNSGNPRQAENVWVIRLEFLLREIRSGEIHGSILNLAQCSSSA